MCEEEFIALTLEQCKTDEGRAKLLAGLPLGLDAMGNFVFSKTSVRAYTAAHTCVTGARRTMFIRRLLCCLSCVYPKEEATFLVLSPHKEYGELLRLHGVDATVPYINGRADLDLALACIRELVSQYAQGGKYPKLFLVLDGLEELPQSNQSGMLEEYRAFLELVVRYKNVHVISGADLMQSVFSDDPGVFVGVGNTLITAQEEDRADVTYVHEDHSLSMPSGIIYPNTPSLLETIIYLNARLAKDSEDDGE